MSEAVRELPKEAERAWEACFPVPVETARQLRADTEQLGAYLAQMGQMMLRMQERLDEMERNQRKVSLTHEDVKGIMMLIRLRADEFCERYQLTGPGDAQAVRGAMKRDIQKRYQVKDLHDVPAIARSAVESQIARWSNVRLMMERRARASGSG